MTENKVVLIPSLEPDERLPLLIQSLQEQGFRRIVLVDDGSSDQAQGYFDLAGQMGCVVIHHDSNYGKGEALKTGFCAAVDTFGYEIDVITADADGQHLPRDIRRIADAMDLHPGSLVLGTRDFSGKDVPWKSRMGNRITAAVFRAVTGVRIPDTQTGLRGIPAGLLQLALHEEGSRYEYEMNFLTDAAAAAEIVTVPIETVYENGNRSSHFRPLRDSLRVYGRIVRFAAASLAGALTDYTLFLLLFALLEAVITDTKAILFATILARCVSGLVNFFLNKHWSFRSDGATGREALRYGVLFLALMGLSSLGVMLLSSLLPVWAAKLLTDTLLFCLSYIVQQRWVFRTERISRNKNNESKRRLRIRWAPLYAFLLTCYTVFTLLNAFVIPQDIVAAESAVPAAEESVTIEAEPSADAVTAATEEASPEETENSAVASAAPSVTGSSYESDTLTIMLRDETVNDTTVHIAEVWIKDASQLRAGLADGSFGRNIKEPTSDIAESSGAVLAINGDYYGFRDSGYVLRNGQLYRDTPSGGEDLVLYEDGTLEIIDEDNVTAQELVDAGAVQIWSFGPGLVEHGVISVSENYEVEQAMRSNPRTAIGQIDEGHYVLVVSEGRTEEDAGLTVYELAEVMQRLGCETAYNLDGGGSSTMWFNGELVNSPSGGRHGSSERSVSDIIYVG
ncbi:MAG: phosphodiester glycosidase family protein [Mogibacterium sp.]|nr:phosphodiester glycosidase family protein [Mogibacterium sp.]